MTHTIVLMPPFRHNAEFAYIAAVPQEAVVRGDSSDEPSISPIVLTEDGVPLGPGHSQHYAIRSQGKGRFSHWNDALYFSTSDNTDPNTNGRSYAIMIPSGDDLAFHRQALLESVGGDPGLTFAVLRAGINTNGSPLSLYLNAFCGYRSVMQRAGIDLRDKVVLEIGSGPHLGTALAFLLHGARKVISNDIGNVNTTVPRDYAQIIQLLAKAASNHATKPLCEIVRPVAGMDDAVEIVPGIFEAIPRTGAEALSLPDESVDLIVSTSVFEHVTKPREVIANSFRIVRRGGFFIHSIDLRDHSNFLDPLGFLRKSREEYEPCGTENRVRALEFVRMFENAGFDIRTVEFFDLRGLINEFGETDCMAWYLSFCHSQVYQSIDSVEPWVSEAERATFDPEFRAKSLRELSALAVRILGRKA